MKSNPESAHDASAKLLRDLIAEIDEWGTRATRTSHFATLANERIGELLFPGSVLKGNTYLISQVDRQILGFLVSEAEIEAASACNAANALSDKLQSLLGSMNEVSACAN